MMNITPKEEGEAAQRLVVPPFEDLVIEAVGADPDQVKDRRGHHSR